MRTATPEEISVLELLAVELEHDHAQRAVISQARDRELRAIERELASAVSLVGDLAARALAKRCEVLETSHAARLPDHEGGERFDAIHERLDHALETLAVAGFHWKWSEPSKRAYAG